MIEKIITSKTRAKILKLFLINIDNRYYLRELERLLGESLSPLRRQLIKLVNLGILTVEDEANLKYYRLNKNFAGIEELRKLVLGKVSLPEVAEAKPQIPRTETLTEVSPRPEMAPVTKRARYDIMMLTLVSLIVLIAAAFVVYTSTKNIKQITSFITNRTLERAQVTSYKKATPTRSDEMVSGSWKLLPGNIPVLSGGGTGGEKKSKEL